MSRSVGAGRPLTFGCAKCRRRMDLDGRAVLAAFVVTGKRRLVRGVDPEGPVLHRIAPARYEYVCSSCGHRGWSRHPQVHEAWRRQRADSV